MFKYFSVTLVAFSIFNMCSPVHAQSVALNLNPKESKVIENNYLWSLQATCAIECSDSTHKIIVSVVKNNGVVNGKNLSSGQTTSVVVRNHDSIAVSAEPGAKVNLKNTGSDVVRANCST